jgi:hypothetical protein
MHPDTMYAAQRIEAELQISRLERARLAQEATDSTSRRPSLAFRVRHLFGRAGTRLHGAPDGTGVRPAKPGAALS